MANVQIYKLGPNTHIKQSIHIYGHQTQIFEDIVRYVQTVYIDNAHLKH